MNNLIVDWNHPTRLSRPPAPSGVSPTEEAAPADVATPRRRPTSHSVRFNQNVRCLIIPGVWQLSQDDIAATWYGPNDSHLLKKDTKRNVRRMRSSSQAAEDDRHCYRGLEHLRSSATLRRLTEEKALTIATVVESQDSPNATPKSIAAASERLTRSAKNRAIQAAMQDEADAQAIMRLQPSSKPLPAAMHLQPANRNLIDKTR